MLKITFAKAELFNNETQQFFDIPGGTFNFEHSLLSVSKWESKYCKPFLTDDETFTKTASEWMYYFKCMCTNENFNPALITSDTQTKLLEYIKRNQTATRIKPSKPDPGKSKPYMSSELLYANMANTNVPFTAERWPLSRLMALLGIIADQNTDPKDKQMSADETREMQRRLNEQRRKEMNSKG